MNEDLIAKKITDFGDVIEMFTVVRNDRRFYIVQVNSFGIKSRQEFERVAPAYDLYKAAI